ncbi:MAG: imidazole glycerol phosphate synthase subunit HisF [Candidatus Dormiibacterota bacterium]
MVFKRVIACLDVAGGRVVKGRSFSDLRDQGDPVSLAARYAKEGADEVVLLDVVATPTQADITLELVARVARELPIPFTVGGGVRTVADFARLVGAGADKVSVQTAAVQNPQLIFEAATEFGSQCVVVAIDARRRGGGWEVRTHGGSRFGHPDALSFAALAARLGAGELLLTSIDADGQRRGYDLELTRSVSEAVGIPVIASGGAGGPADVAAVLTEGRADAALVASIVHDGSWTVAGLRASLRSLGVDARP